MDTADVYPAKAKYGRYRWDYTPQVVQALLDTTHLSRTSMAADVGADTGILSRHLAGHVGHLYAVEPNPAMRRVARCELQRFLFAQR